MIKSHSTLFILIAVLSGCASQPPAALRDAPKTSPGLNQVQAHPDNYAETRLRWGGTIARVENLPQTTRIEVIARKLYSTGEPIDTDSSEGRFLAQFDVFLDPAIYAAGRAITVVGNFVKVEERELDQMRYRYPLVRVSSHHLWPEPEPVDTYRDPYWDPYWPRPLFYDPWYPWGHPYHYPYWPHHY